MNSEFDRLKLLVDYTLFHIGLYTALATLALAFAQTARIEKKLLGTLKLTACSFLFAGFAGGVVAGNAPRYEGFSAFWDAPIGPWGLRMLPARTWAGVEHTVFWVGVFIGAWGFIGIRNQRSRRKAIEELRPWIAARAREERARRTRPS